MDMEASASSAKLSEAKEIKVRIPLDYHIKLHTLKVLKGQSISDTVEIALAKYFTDFPGDDRAVTAVAARALGAFHV